MKKRILSLFLALALICAMLPAVLLTASAETLSGACGENLTWTLDAESGTLTVAGSGAMFNYSSYSDHIMEPWYDLRETIKRVELPEGLTEIGEYAFLRCSALESVNFPNGLKRIGTGAFKQCAALTEIEVPDSVERIEMQAFNSCVNLATVSLPDTLKELGFQVFNGTALVAAQITEESTDVYVDNYLVAAPKNNSSEPINYHVKDGTVGIAAGAFNVFGDILSVYIPSSVRMFSERAFDDDRIQNVYIKDGIEEIGSFVFYGESLNHIELPASVKKIDAHAFAGTSDAPTGRVIPELCFHGAAPEAEEGAFLHENGKKAVGCVYFLTGQSGWTYPKWNDIAAHWWNGETVNVNHCIDINATGWYRRAVDFVIGNGLMNGVSDSRFDPDGSMTRAMLVTVLWRYEGSPEEGKNTFSDVPNDEWYTKAVAWAAENGIVGGVGDGKFDPNGNITREQMAAILYRYAGKKGFDTSKKGDLSAFPDQARVSAYATDAINWTVAEGIINGNGGRLDPQGNATRAQVATILMRFIENIATIDIIVVHN